MGATKHAIGGFAIVAIAASGVLGAIDPRALESDVRREGNPPAWPEEAPAYVGSDACTRCHFPEHRAWRDSGHRHATAEPTPRSVLAPFEGEVLTRGTGDRVESLRFAREGRTYVVDATMPDAPRRRFEVAYTFGASPLQTVLLAGRGGRLHALPAAWDSRAKRDGGGKWVALDAHDPRARDFRRFLSRGESWNARCAECHSTFVEQNYDVVKDAYATRFAAIDVGCEACHGPGSRHLAWTERHGDDVGIVNPLRGDHTWTLDPRTGSARPHAGPSTAEIETCAACHSRREAITASHHAGSHLLDDFRPELRANAHDDDPHGMHATSEWGPFASTAMHDAGVACSDCHEPHRGTLLAEGDALCTRCHAPLRFANVAHPREPHARGVTCIGCHMKARSSGLVVRHDHSFRPSSSALAEGASASSRSAATAPAFVRANALLALSHASAPLLVAAVEEAVHDDDALVRMAAAIAAATLPPDVRVDVLGPLLGDTRLAVRIEAARSLADVPREALDETKIRNIDAALDELVESERVHSDDAEAWRRIASVERARGRATEADAADREARRQSE